MYIGQTPISVDAMCRHRLFASRVRGWGLKTVTTNFLRSGIAKGAINAAWDAIGEVIFFCSFEHALIPSRLGRADASIALLSLLSRFGLHRLCQRNLKFEDYVPDSSDIKTYWTHRKTVV